MTDRRAEGSGGYRGALPPGRDTLAAPWVIAVFAIFVLIFALSLAGIPSRLVTSPSPNPSGIPSASASGSAGPSASGAP
jgi:thiol:disulfide interchange protein